VTQGGKDKDKDQDKVSGEKRLPIDRGYESIRSAVKAVSKVELEESLQLLRYDIHREVQDIVREQIRQFAIAKNDTAQLVEELSSQLKDLLQANRELRAENEYLRNIY
jgi:hypothetical protein